MFRTGGFTLNGTVALILNLIAAVLVWRFVLEHTDSPESMPVVELLE